MSTSTAPRPTRRFRKSADASRVFVDAALAALSRDGLAGLTVQRLAADTGYAVGALYRHFASKEALLIAVQGAVVEALDHDLERAMAAAAVVAADAAPDVLPVLCLMATALCYEALLTRRPAHFALISHSLADPRPLVGQAEAAVLLPSLLALVGRVGLVIEMAGQAGVLAGCDTARRTLLLWSTVHGVLLMHKLQRFAPAESLADGLVLEAVATLLIGWGAAPPVVAAAKEMVTMVMMRTFAEETV
jgi:AcrR family transcriptional regulator